MRCPACGATISDTSRFCPECGARLAVQGEERRIVTVLFADIVGFTSLSERRDPEQVKHLVDQCFQWLTAEIVGFGGRVDKIIGDAILALFGAPVAHEDDAERAVRAALRMQAVVDERTEELGGMVRLRIGVNTGEVLVGALAAGGDYTAMGDVVNTANRLQTAAQPGEVLVGDSTYAATTRVVPYLERGVVPAKGRDAPVHAWLAQVPRTAPGERPGRKTGPLVGRANEVAVLGQVATMSLEAGRAALLVLLGEAGVGKSRVVQEVATSLGRTRGALVLEGRCVPYGEVNVWWPLADALRGVLGTDFADPIEVAEPQVRSLVTKIAPSRRSEREVRRTTAGLLGLLGYGEARGRGADADVAGDEAKRSFITLLDDLCADRPVVLWLSDLHWADDVVLDVVEQALVALARRPVVIVGTARRSLLDRWAPPTGRFDTVALNLEALDPAAAAELVDALLAEAGGRTMGDAAKAELRERSGGNPLFLVELVALLGEEREGGATPGAALGALPDTLRGLVAARLDNLGRSERAVIDDASVLGRRGRVAHLAEMSRQIRGLDDVTDPLQKIASRELMRVEGDIWEFTSDVTREVAYGMLTKSARAKKHLGVAQWVESEQAGPVSDRIADLLAHHYGRAAELLDDLGTLEHLSGDVRERALHWIDEVSARGERMRLLPAVERLCSQGLALAGDGFDELRFALVLRRAAARTLARDGDGASADAQTAARIAERLGDPVAAAKVLLVEGEIEHQRGGIDRALATFADAVRRFEAAGDDAGHAEALRALGMAEMFSGRTAQAEATTSRALVAFRALGHPAGEAWALQNLGWISFARGRSAEAGERAAESLALFEEAGNVGGAAWALGLQGYVCLAEGDLAGAEALQQRVLTDAEDGGDRWATAMMLMLGSIVRLWTGRTESALEMAGEGFAIFEAVHDRFGLARIVWPLARSLAMRGEFDAARRALDDVLVAIEDASAGASTVEDRSMLAVARASVEVHAGNPEAAFDALGRLGVEVGLDTFAAWLEDDEDRGELPEEVAVTLNADIGSDLATSTAVGLAQMGRLGDAAAVIDSAERSAAPDAVSTAVAAAGAVVRAARGETSVAEALAATVSADPHATYLDRTMAAVASGLAAARLGNIDAADVAFAGAGAAVNATGDLLTQAIVGLATSRAFAALAGPQTGADGSDVPRASGPSERLLDMGIDAHGWVQLFDFALGQFEG